MSKSEQNLADKTLLFIYWDAILHAKLLSILHAICLAQNLQCSHLLIESECLTTINYLTVVVNTNGDDRALMKSFSFLGSFLKLFPRSSNVAADLLAKWVFLLFTIG